jgi:hypothetical protein
MTPYIVLYSTRSNQGIVTEHKTLEEALLSFISSGGYRLDFYFSDETVLHIHRDEYDKDIPEEKKNHPAYANMHQAIAKVLVYDPHQKLVDEDSSNVIHVDFS